MSKKKIIFCLFLIFLSCLYLKDKLNEINLYEVLIKDNKTSTIISSTINSKLSLNKESIEKNKLDVKKITIKQSKPIVYIYNTHQTEEYGKNIYNITPTVVTVSNILEEELKNRNISSFVETNSVIKDLEKSGQDYSYTYEITLNYLKRRKKQYPTLKYYFDIHRDSVKGKSSKISINKKEYAKVMFLIGKKNPNYKQNEKNIKIMISYLNKNYPGLIRNTYYQPKYYYNQDYSANMFLIEIGGVDNTLEELYNTSVALSDAIYYYIKGEDYDK